VLRRNPLTGEVKASLRHAPAEPSQRTLVRMSGRRWPIATCVEGGTPYLGRGAYEGRSWRGWQHHLTRCLLAHCLLVRTPLRFKTLRPA
jgi:SRSO17 transposase